MYSLYHSLWLYIYRFFFHQRSRVYACIRFCTRARAHTRTLSVSYVHKLHSLFYSSTPIFYPCPSLITPYSAFFSFSFSRSLFLSLSLTYDLTRSAFFYNHIATIVHFHTTRKLVFFSAIFWQTHPFYFVSLSLETLLLSRMPIGFRNR